MRPESSSGGRRRVAYLTGPGEFTLRDEELPALKPGEVAVRVAAAGICTSDVRKFETLDGGAVTLPAKLGHEWVGTVVSVGPSVGNIKIGDRILGDGYDGYCSVGVVDLNLEPPLHLPTPLVVPEELSDELAVLVEPLADCIHAIRDIAAIQPGERLAVVGVGVMGLMCARVARDRGSEVTVVERLEHRRRLATKHSHHQGVDLNDAAPRSFEALVLTPGDPSLIGPCLGLLADGGTLVLFGGFPRPSVAHFDPNEVHYRELRIVGSEWVGCGRRVYIDCYSAALNMLRDGALDQKDVVTHVFSLDQIQEAFALAKSVDSMKVVVRP